MSEASTSRQYREYTRYLRPVRPVQFTDIEMLQSVVQCLDPEDVASVAQLLGNRRGVVRITMKTSEGVGRLEEAIQRRRLVVAGTPLGLVEDGGQFIVVVLDNVPQYITDEQVEQEMSKYGTVVNCSKDFIDVHGCRIENERRNVQFTMIFNRAAIVNGELDMFGTTVYAKAPYADLDKATDGNQSTSGGTGTNSAESGSRPETGQPHGKQHRHHHLSGSAEPASGIRSGSSMRDRATSGGSGAWKRASILVTSSMRPEDGSAATVHQSSTAAEQAESGTPATKATGALGADLQQQQQQQQSQRNHSPSSGGEQAKSPRRSSIAVSRGGHDRGDARQIQKRTEAFEQLSAFLQ